MPQLAPSAAPVTDLLLYSDISHEICCSDENAESGRIAMCGIELPDAEELDDGTPTCVVCQHLIEQWAHYADLYGDGGPKQPGDPPCRVCPRRTLEVPDA